MAVVMGSGNTSITGSVDAVPIVKVVTWITGQGDNTNVTLGTVPGTKKWSIVGASLSWSAGGAATKYCSLQANGVNLLGLALQLSATSGNLATSEAWNYGQCPVLAAGQTIVLINTNGANYPAIACVQYIEEDA